MIWLNGRREPRSTLTCGVNDGQALLKKVKQGVGNKQGKTFDHQSSRSRKLRAKMRLVAATRLQEYHPSFWLRTSSNTPSVLTNYA
jgi:hypothetical protein